MAQSAVYPFRRNTPNPGRITISDFQRKPLLETAEGHSEGFSDQIDTSR